MREKEPGRASRGKATRRSRSEEQCEQASRKWVQSVDNLPADRKKAKGTSKTQGIRNYHAQMWSISSILGVNILKIRHSKNSDYSHPELNISREIFDIHFLTRA
jgi:hypothetical protein